MPRHYLTEDELIHTGAIRFIQGTEAKPLEDIPKTLFSEVFRDIDLVVSVADRGNDTWSSSSVKVIRRITRCTG